MSSASCTSSFTLFPNLPIEIQDQIWDILAREQSDSLPPRIHPIARDPESWRLPGLESDLRCLPQPPHLEIQLNLVYRSYPLPALFKVLFILCRGSRDAMKRLNYCVWERKKRGYVYVNKEKDIFYFSGWGGDYWVLLKALTPDASKYGEEDEIARQQFMVQLQGCRNIAFDVVTSPIHACETEQVLSWLDTFKDMRSLIVVFGMRSDYRLRPEMEFWLVDEETLMDKYRLNGREFKAMIERLRKVEEELRVNIPAIEAVFALHNGDGLVSDLTFHSS
ncbi:hypothetical protein N431DRAFT_435911 [Stipitochalara longipes BDJ]|nr:hypothetical protein N431DRAFT_435911 [Stipitochalara longipes BDJ]